MQFEGSYKFIEIFDMLYLGATAGAGAIAWHIWSGDKISMKRVVALFVLSAIFAVVVYLWTWTSMSDDPTKHFAISILGGIGATDLVAAVFGAIRARITGATKQDGPF